MQILRVDVGQKTAVREDLDSEYQNWAGRGLVAKFLQREVPPTCAPLGPDNKLIIANGFFAGTRLASAGRVSVGAKSPLTGGAKESNSGGTAGDALAKLGLRAIVLQGAPADGAVAILRVTKDNAELMDGEEYRLNGTYALCEKLRERFGKNVSIVSIGQAGEYKLTGAGVSVTDAEGLPGRYAGRGGLGAVMGSKGIKAIVIDDIRGEVPMVDKQAFQDGQKRFNKILIDNPVTKAFQDLGTLMMVDVMHQTGAVPTKNFSQGTFPEHYESMTAPEVRRIIMERGGEGKPTHACMQGCIARCSNVFPDAEGKAIVSPLEYENYVMLGPNCGIFSPEQIARLNRRCNDYGLDTIEMGVSIGVAMEAGIIPFGDFDGAANLLDQVAEGTPLVRVVGMGAATVGRVYGVARVPTTKGQGMPAYDPRGVKGLGVTYATSPMGADHTAGHTGLAPVDPHLPDNQVETSMKMQVGVAGTDTICLCDFGKGPFVAEPALLAEMMKAVNGMEIGPNYIDDTGAEVLKMERAFNLAAGLTKVNDRLPEFFRREKLAPFDLVYDVPQAEIDQGVAETME
jgi:aldehyde:ferredoxin oxidoreductase